MQDEHVAGPAGGPVKLTEFSQEPRFAGKFGLDCACREAVQGKSRRDRDVSPLKWECFYATRIHESALWPLSQRQILSTWLRPGLSKEIPHRDRVGLK